MPLTPDLYQSRPVKFIVDAEGKSQSIRAMRLIKESPTQIKVFGLTMLQALVFRSNGGFRWFDSFEEAQDYLMAIQVEKLAKVSQNMVDLRAQSASGTMAYLTFKENELEQHFNDKVKV
jgi:hypothetical protein